VIVESVGRMELWARLGRITVAEAMVDRAAAYAAERAWRARLSGEFDRPLPDGHGWHTSMHISSFPGDDSRACPRALAYGLMGFAQAEPMPQRVPAAGIVGTAIENWLVSMLGFDGRVLSLGTDTEHQIDLEDADHWLTGSPDLVVLPPGWNRPLVIEVKGEKIERVEEMRALKRSYRPGHARQLRGYLGLGSHVSQLLWPTAVICKHTWRLAELGNEPVIDAMVCADHGIHADSGCLIEVDLEPIRDGVVLYCARDNPEVRASWYFEHDEQWFQRGLALLRRAQEHYASDLIPAHPFGGKQWSAEPCKYCVDPDSLILCADLIWRRAGDLSVGQQIIGFDEHNNGTNRSRYRPSTIESHDLINRPRLTIETELGATTVSIDHEFLVQPTRSRQRRRRFVRADELQVGDVIVAFGKPWRSSFSWEAGWLAGLFDGEGCVTRGHLSVAQRPDAVLEAAKTILSSFGFDWREHESVNGKSALGSTCSRLHISQLYEQLRLLGTIRPMRLLASADSLWNDAATWSQITRNAHVLRITDRGEGNVVAMKTSTSTFISDGLLSHNCDYKKNVCKPDHQAGVHKLTESHGVEWSRGVYGEYAYNPERIRQEVLDRWRGREGYGYSLPPGYEIGRRGVQKERAHV
jgi:hypothetical protein